MVSAITQAYGISERHSCALLDLHRSSNRYQPTDKTADEELIRRMQELAAHWRRFGYRRIHLLLKKADLVVNEKRTYRLYRLAGLSLRKIRKKKRYQKRGRPETAQREANYRWSMDFMQDRTMNGQKLRLLTVVDEISRECPVIAVDTSITGRKVAAILNQVRWFHQLPKEIKTDNGPEFTGSFLHQWCEEHKVDHVFTEPGSPTQNGHIESFNGRLRDECLNLHCFKNLAEARDIIEKWRIAYNTERPHTSLNGMTPEAYRRMLEAEEKQQDCG